jgi:hypothetical protein
MAPLIPIALAAGVIALLVSKSGGGDVRDAAIETTLGPLNTTKGRSGVTWDVGMVTAPAKPLSDGGSAVMQVIFKGAQSGAKDHMVIQYMQTGTGTPPLRVLVKKGPSTPGLIQSAIADFGVTGPAAEAAAKGQ